MVVRQEPPVAGSDVEELADRSLVFPRSILEPVCERSDSTRRRDRPIETLDESFASASGRVRILAATTEYEREQDPLAGFLVDCCDVGRGYLIRSVDLERAYREWAADNDRDPLSLRALAPKLAGKGFRKAKDMGERCWRGLRLRPVADTSDTSPPCPGVSSQGHSHESNYPKSASNVSDVSTGGSRDPGEDG